MSLDSTHFIHLANGQFQSTTPEQLRAAFTAFENEAPPAGWVVHFHGGLTTEESGREIAADLMPAYSEAGAFPFFFIWESGPWETVRNNLQDIASEVLFQKLTSYLVEYLLGKLRPDLASLAEEGGAVTPPHSEVEAWLTDSVGQPAKSAPYDEVTTADAREGLTGNEVVTSELEQLLASDAQLDLEISKLNQALQAPAKVPSTEATATGIGFATPGHLSPRALQELTGVEEDAAEVPSVDPQESLFGITIGRVAIAAARIGYRVVRRYMKGRDHGLYTTVVEEILRDLYVDELGSTVFWNQMKRDTLDAFGDEPETYGGTAFLHLLKDQIERLDVPPRVTLVGHSAGAIYACNFLKAADALLPRDFQFDVVLLAPAVDFKLFQQARNTQRIANVRIFGLDDARESSDALLAGYSAGLRHIYPKSLLYFVAGLLETEVDRPILGMQRYYLGSQYSGRLFLAETDVRGYLGEIAGGLVWAPSTTGPEGMRSDSAAHGDFDREDPLTLASVVHILRNGFGTREEPVFGVGEAAVSPSVTRPFELRQMIDSLPPQDAMESLRHFSTLIDSTGFQTECSDGVTSALEQSIPMVQHRGTVTDDELAKMTLKVASENGSCQELLTDVIAGRKKAVADDAQLLSPESAVLIGLQSQISLQPRKLQHQAFDVRVSQPSLELSQAVTELVKRTATHSPEVTTPSEQTSEIVINEERLLDAFKQLRVDELQLVFERLTGKIPPGINDSNRDVFAQQLIDQTVNDKNNAEDVLVQAHQALPYLGLMQRFLRPELRVSRSLAEQLSSYPIAASLEDVIPAPPVSSMTIRLSSPDVSLDGTPGINILSKVGPVVVATGSFATIESLKDNSQVLSVDGPNFPFSRECVRSIPFVKADLAKQQTAEAGEKCLVAIVDGGIDVFHRAFRRADDPSQTRLIGVWDLSDKTGPAPTGAGGTYHTQDDINAYIQRNQTTKLRDSVSGHGTHVASIAAGTRPQDPQDQLQFPGGVAHEAPILVVITGESQYEEGSPSHLGYSETHISALEFIGRKADELGLPVVVNISQGEQSGGHDGTTALEAAIDHFTESGRKAGRAIVKSAGNDRANLGHAYVTMNCASAEVLQWNSNVQQAWPKGRVKDIIELWFEPSEKMVFQLVNPDAEASLTVHYGNPVDQGIFQNGNAYKMEYARRFRDNGHGRLRIEVERGTAAAIQDGTWQLEIVNQDADRPQEIHAWVERSDWQPVSFLNFPHVETTITVPGTAQSVITVAAVQKRDNAIQVASFSGYGKTRDGREKPEISAPGVDISAAKSRSEFDFTLKSGTSMAAPHVTGAIALVFSACAKDAMLAMPSANDIRSAFRTLNNTNRWDRGSGYGLLDVQELMDKFLN